MLSWIIETYPNEDFNSIGMCSATPLWLAACNRHHEVVEMVLLREGVDRNKISLNISKGGGATPLYIAARNGHVAVVKLLVASPDVDVNKLKPDNSHWHAYGETPLITAARWGYVDVAQVLLASPDVDVNKAGENVVRD